MVPIFRKQNYIAITPPLSRSGHFCRTNKKFEIHIILQKEIVPTARIGKVVKPLCQYTSYPVCQFTNQVIAAAYVNHRT